MRTSPTTVVAAALWVLVGCDADPAASPASTVALTTEPDTITPAPDTIAPDTTAPDTITAETSAPDTIAPDTTAPDTITAETSAPDTAEPVVARALGTVTAAGACDLETLLVGARCERYVVHCDGLADDATVALVIADPTGDGPVVGTILLGSGSAGASLIEKAATDPDTGRNPLVEEMELLRADGFRVVERAWQGERPGDRGWIRGSAGPDDSACRYATLARWLHDRHADEAASFCALGFSGGSMELAQAMTHWGTADLLDHAVFESGPVARSDHACIGGPANDAACADVHDAYPWDCTSPPLSCVLGDDITLLLDTAYDGVPACSSRDPAYAAMLQRDSALGPGSTRAFPGTGLTTILGMRDCGSGAATGGADFATRVTGRGGLAPEVVVVPTAGHTVHARPEGARAIRDALAAGCTRP